MVIMKRLMAIFFILISSPVTADFESDLKRCLPESQHGIIDLIVQGESQRQPYAIGYVKDGKLHSLYPKSLPEARKTLRSLLSQGLSVDIGYGQINSQHFKKGREFAKRGFLPEDAFDPCINLKMSAYIFSEAYRRTGSYVEALSIYNTGDPHKGLSNGYVKRIAQFIQ
jgi:type IV secretion system protein VirB1